MNKLDMAHCTIITPDENFGTKQIKSILMKSEFKKSRDLISKTVARIL